MSNHSDLFDLPFEEDRPDQSTGRLEPRRPWSVTELTVHLRDALESRFDTVWIEGELSNCRVWNTGHFYFTLKDSASQLRGFMFRSTVRYLKFKPSDGLRVVARGRISVYEPKGEYQLVCEYLEPQGIGALQLAFEQRKKLLQAEGLFDHARKRQLPTVPRKIGVVTSLDGAAIRDIIKVLSRRHISTHVVIRPSRVQGEGAAMELAQAIRAICRVPDVDVVIVGRGGGSTEDLWAFNEEILARVIASAPVPVVSAVGHETDVTIADLVADLRAPTPSAAAEMVVAPKEAVSNRVDRLGEQVRAAIRGRMQALAARTHALEHRPALLGFPGRVAMHGRRSAELHHALVQSARALVVSRNRHATELRRRLEARNLGRQLAHIRTRLTTVDGRLSAGLSRRRDTVASRLGVAVGRLEALSPLAVLGRGYALCWTADRLEVIRDAATVDVGTRVQVVLARGGLDCEVRARSFKSTVE